MTTGISHAVRSSFGSHPDRRRRVQGEEKGRRQHARVLINDNHHSPLNASDRP
jgi:hypothetical protein